MNSKTPLLDTICSPADLKELNPKQLIQLSKELRQDIIDVVSETGGHLGASLGVIELTVALHKVFDTPQDIIIWDVGHQAYPHKILTGRREQMRTIRTGGGLSGFTKRTESEYDPFGTAHASTSISAGLGFSVAKKALGEPGCAIAVIGDGSLTGGMSFEGLNHAGELGYKLIVIVNDNQMSIDPPVGALSEHLRKLGDSIRSAQDRNKSREHNETTSRTFFECLDFEYLGPIDGHCVNTVADILAKVKDDDYNKPVVIHLITEKGKGFKPAEESFDKLHGVGKFDKKTGKSLQSSSNVPTYTKVFSTSLIQAARKDPKIVGITAAMPSGTGLNQFAKEFPTRTFDVGLAEQHAVTFAAGLAAGGLRPFAAIYSTFLQRAYDQIVHDVAIQNLPVRFALDRAGYVGADGQTHCGAFDIAYLGCLPNFTLMAPADEAELKHMVVTAAHFDAGPIAFRYPRGSGVGVDLPDEGKRLEIGKGRILYEGSKVALLSYGATLQASLSARKILEQMGISTTVADARFAKPLDKEMLGQLASNHDLMITIEEGSIGGFATQVSSLLNDEGFLHSDFKIRSMFMPDNFLDQDTPDKQRDFANLVNTGIVEKALSSLNETSEPQFYEQLTRSGTV